MTGEGQDRDELLKLLDQVSGEPGVEQSIEDTEDLEKTTPEPAPEIEPELAEILETQEEADPEPKRDAISQGIMDAAGAPDGKAVADLSPEPEPLIPDEATPQVQVDPEVEIYSSITLTGLRTHRPDLVQAVEKSAGRTKAQKRPPSEKDASADFVAYFQIGVGMLQDDPASVTGRRLANVRTKYLRAVASANVELPDGTDVTFVINGAQINAAWAGQKPTGLPSDLDV